MPRPPFPEPHIRAYSARNIDASQILTRGEFAKVLADLKRRARRLPNVQMNMAVVRLTCCYGLRASEIAGLSLGDVHTGISRLRPGGILFSQTYVKWNRRKSRWKGVAHWAGSDEARIILFLLIND